MAVNSWTVLKYVWSLEDQMMNSTSGNKWVQMNGLCKNLCVMISPWGGAVSSLLGQITVVRPWQEEITGLCVAGSGRSGREESGAWPSWPDRWSSSQELSVEGSSMSLIGCLRLWVWLGRRPTAPNLWTASMCGTLSGDCELLFIIITCQWWTETIHCTWSKKTWFKGKN